MSQRLSQNWSIEDSSEIYGVDYWGAGYFGINAQGNVEVTPFGEAGPRVDLKELTSDLIDRGIRSPLLIRFPDILDTRVKLIAGCFRDAMNRYGYRGQYRGVYPIKVNQQRHLVEELVRCGRETHLGLECGSKPELLVVLALMQNPEALIICNGFKDSEYIETAILSQKLGRNTLVVVDRMSELPMIIEIARKLSARPKIGFRAKLYSKGAGRWTESSGTKSKFGLTPPELVEGLEMLKAAEMLDSLELVHFHVGSQIPSIQSIKSSLKEGARYYTQLHALGARPKYIDVGGGLGVDYDSTRASDSSTNYTEQEYANDVVSIIQSVCDEDDVPHPDIITESGRALTAHHSVLIFDVLGRNCVRRPYEVEPPSRDDHNIIHELYQLHQNLSKKNMNETYNDLMQAGVESSQLFNYGVLDLRQRAKCETLFWKTTNRLLELSENEEDAELYIDHLKSLLSDTYYCNFSVFQSVPDSWAINQVFPVMPIHKLEQKPEVNAAIVDLTCDSDGKLDNFVDRSSGEIVGTIPLHPFVENGEDYHIGVFLVGAYQEILGDLHNLFGDTDAVHVTLSEAGYTIDHVVEGDSVAEVLSYLEYNRAELLENVRKSCEEGILRQTITKQEAKLLIRHYEMGLAGYTYLEDPE